MKAMFVGKNRSIGLKTGEIYDIWLFKQQDPDNPECHIRWEPKGVFAQYKPHYRPYESKESLLKNWILLDD